MTDVKALIETVRVGLANHHSYRYQEPPKPLVHDDAACEVDDALAALERLVGASDKLAEHATELTDVETWEHRCSDGVGGCTAVSASKMEELRQALEPFRAALKGDTPDPTRDAVRCEGCGRTFDTERGLHVHQARCYHLAMLTACPICVGGHGSACWSHFA